MAHINIVKILIFLSLFLHFCSVRLLILNTCWNSPKSWRLLALVRYPQIPAQQRHFLARQTLKIISRRVALTTFFNFIKTITVNCILTISHIKHSCSHDASTPSRILLLLLRFRQTPRGLSALQLMHLRQTTFSSSNCNLFLWLEYA